MRNNESFLCSELIRISTGRHVEIGNLEQISAQGCTISTDAVIPAGHEIRMRCLTCPLGKKSCTECRFKGRVQSHDNDPVLGCSIYVEFYGRNWSAEEWRPRHLTNITAVKPLTVARTKPAD